MRSPRVVPEARFAATRRPLHRFRPAAVFQHTRLQPFLDQADDPLVADTVSDETDQPVVADRIKEPGDVGVENPADFACLDPERERVQRIVLAAPSWRSHASHGRRNP